MWKYLKALWRLGDCEKLKRENEQLRRERDLYKDAFEPLLKRYNRVAAASKKHVDLRNWVERWIVLATSPPRGGIETSSKGQPEEQEKKP